MESVQGRVRAYFDKFKSQTRGSISCDDGEFLVEMLMANNVQRCLEVGVASGLSSGFMLTAMDLVNPQFELISCDFSKTYYIDPTKPVGFIVDEITPPPRCRFELHPKRWAGALPEILKDRMIDAAFIDANHRHPWPLFDTLLTLPHLRPGGVLIYHDILLYQQAEFREGIGPHYVFEGLASEKCRSHADNASIGAVRFDRSLSDYENDFLKILEHPWTLPDVLPPAIRQAILNRVRQFYSDDLWNRLDEIFNDHERNYLKQAG